MVATPTISITGVVSSAYMSFKDGVSSFISKSNFSATSTGTRSDVGSSGYPGGYVLYEGINFGTQVKISKDGSTLVTNSHGGRMIYIYRKENGSWSLKQSIYGGDRDTDGIYGYTSGSPNDPDTTSYTDELVELYFGAKIDISEDGNIIAVGSADKVAATDGDQYIDNSNNKLFIYENIGNNKWELTFESTQGGAFSFYDFDLSDDGTFIAGLWPRRANSSESYIENLILTNLGTGSASVAQQSSGYRLYSADIGNLSDGDIALSGDKLTLVQIGGGSGKIYVWTRASVNSYFSRSPNKTITQPNYNTDPYVEQDIAISYNGEYIAYSSTKWNNASRLNVFKKDSGGNWSQFGTTLTDPQLPSIDSNFGFSVDISGDGKVIAVGSPNKNGFYETVSGNESNLSKPSYVYFYKYTENGFVYNSVITNETSPHITSIGYDVSLSYTGEDFVIGNSPFDPYHSGTYAGTENYDNVYKAKDYINFTSSGSKKQNSTYGGSLGIFSGISSSYEYNWNSLNTLSDGDYFVTVAGTASATSIAYSGTDSITFTLDTSTVTLTG